MAIASFHLKSPNHALQRTRYAVTLAAAHPQNPPAASAPAPRVAELGVRRRYAHPLNEKLNNSPRRRDDPSASTFAGGVFGGLFLGLSAFTWRGEFFAGLLGWSWFFILAPAVLLTPAVIAGCRPLPVLAFLLSTWLLGSCIGLFAGFIAERQFPSACGFLVLSLVAALAMTRAWSRLPHDNTRNA